MDEAILARADALMQRRRAPPGEADEVPVLTAVAVPGDDFPVLTEAVPANPGTAAGPLAPPEAQPANSAAIAPMLADSHTPAPSADLALVEVADPSVLLAALTDELARRVEARLATEVPRLVKDTLQEILAERGISVTGYRRT